MAGYSQRQWEGKFFRCGMRCQYCYVPLTLAEAEKEHLTPRVRGGADTIDNIVPACKSCNSRKGTMTDLEFRTAFSEAFKIISGLPPANISANLELRDQPMLLKQLLAERENYSWWRTA